MKLYHDLLLPKYKDGTLKITKKKEIKVTYESRKHEKKNKKNAINKTNNGALIRFWHLAAQFCPGPNVDSGV